MPLYFFDTANPAFAHRDEEGMIGEDKVEARHLAIRALVKIMADCSSHADQAATIRVRDIAGSHIYAATLRLHEHR